MAVPIQVREAAESDHDILVELHRSLYETHRDQVVPPEDRPLIEYQDYERIIRDDLNGLLKNPNSHILLAEDRGVAVGYITGRIAVEPRRVLPRRGIIEDWYVRPEHRGSGTGKALLQELEKRFTSAGCQVVESATWSSNHDARRIHDTFGFREIRIIYRKRL